MSPAMYETLYRFLMLLAFLGYMAVIYLALHIAAAHFTKSPASRLLWFFSVVTRPLIWPVRIALPSGTPESRLRYLALGLCVVIWLGARLLLAGMNGLAQ
jgi:hypothetical protein